MDSGPRLDRPQLLGVFRQLKHGVTLVWTTSRGLSFALGLLSLVAGVLPAGAAWVGKLIVDAVVRAAQTGSIEDQGTALTWVVVELGLVAVSAKVPLYHLVDVCLSHGRGLAKHAAPLCGRLVEVKR